MARFILASQSKSRLRLLSSIGYEPDAIIPAEIDEEPLKRERPDDYVARISREKVNFVADRNPDDFVLGGDTVMFSRGKILQKASTDEEVAECFRRYSGRKIYAYSGVCLRRPDKTISSKAIKSELKFKVLTELDISKIVATKEGIGKAGGVYMEGYCESLLEWIRGPYSNIMGFPLYTVRNMLLSAGIGDKYV